MGMIASKYFPVELFMVQTSRMNTADGVWGPQTPFILDHKNQFTIETGKVQVSPFFIINMHLS